MALNITKLKRNQTTNYSLAFALVFGRFLGLFPVSGLNEYDNVKQVRLTWKSIHFLYCLYQFSGRMLNTIFGIYDFVVYSKKSFLDFGSIYSE